MNIMTNTVSLTALIEMLRLLLSILNKETLFIRCMITQCAQDTMRRGRLGNTNKDIGPGRPFRGIPKAFYSMD